MAATMAAREYAARGNGPSRRFLARMSCPVVTAVFGIFLMASTGCRRSTENPDMEVPQASSSSGSASDQGGAGPSSAAGTSSAGRSMPESGESTQVADLALGQKLYALHCAGCHGENGDGRGVAAPYLFPKPRDFRAGRFRLVSTKNNVPTPEDLDAVLLRGMPGSSMPSWAHLTSQQRAALVAQVMHLRHEGVRQQYEKVLREQDELTDEEIAQDDVQQEIREVVTRRTTPGESTEVPPIAEPGPQTIARGKDIYFKQGCNSCHGDKGKGDGQKEMVDDENLPTSPRDFTLGIFKGDHSPASLYRRVAYGMPGTPMPASSQLSPTEMVDLVHFIRSLSDEQTRQEAVLRREQIMAKRVATLPDSDESDAWSVTDLVTLRMVPLWWRNDAHPDLQAQAVYDGQTLALRLSWRDATADRQAARSESFEDAVAVEMYRGDAEPFIGMGGPTAPVDVWYWDADRQGPVATVETSYPDTVVDRYPFSEQAVASANLDRGGAKTAKQPDISLPAKASGNQIVPAVAASGSSSLAVGGPGSVTFRIPHSQLVTAHGQWKGGRWTVVMKRPLTVDAEAGVTLLPGDKTSVAFAVWDGAHRDRDGTKLVTIWQDLILEK